MRVGCEVDGEGEGESDSREGRRWTSGRWTAGGRGAVLTRDRVVALGWVGVGCTMAMALGDVVRAPGGVRAWAKHPPAPSSPASSPTSSLPPSLALVTPLVELAPRSPALESAL